MYTTYILYSKSKNRFYVGHSADLKDRLKRHNTGRSKSTKSGFPWTVVYTKEFTTKSEAYQYEMYVKKQKSSEFIRTLINSTE
ncbi:GIY-YIG nuclease family protein [Winogradskyella thalassocola]|uniref:Putative endonuclease n=1 Tax=Winogradskyella thalassocola TaxID=262004 RepID=A0A1G8JJQ7_9FLAO|nr:GIY-YIG nuclease family protein [Winogradskyella thalassocola]SDI31435.1 putative endonuclease [Winogradskyella thalassocola]